MAIAPNTRLAFSPLHRLQWEESQNKYVILYPEGMVELNLPAAETLKLCDGTLTLKEIVLALETQFETSGLWDDIEELVHSALEHGWIRTLS